MTASDFDKALLEMTLEEDEEPYVLPDKPEVKGVALSKDRFQFIFKSERDLNHVLNRGPQTSNSWSIVLDRWVAKPLKDYLKYLFVWVQMRNLLKSEKITIPRGEEVIIRYDYERLQKRCYTCQRMSHEQSMCPIERARKLKVYGKAPEVNQSVKAQVIPMMEVDDPLFGLFPTKFMGKDPLPGKEKIAEEVLEDMRLHIIAASGQDKLALEERVKKSLKDLEDDSMMRQKTLLRLEAPPIISKDLDKRKGLVFDFKAKEDKHLMGEKLMAGAISAGNKVLQSGKVLSQPFLQEESEEPVQSTFLQEGSTGYNIGFHEPSVSGAALKRTYKRRRHGTFTRKANGKGIAKSTVKPGKKVCEGVTTETKRKANDDVEPSQSSERFKKPLVVPNEGPSNI
ncbi:uncharacterized protein LOC108830791 [Raphanus sativus]|uniref:Uncharacterized protein LOC108830791 n=1 Tax=Raphanus sativus TaxID=3726 RepID=A0A6J0LIV9_RAPSA|nr:uncharacterized protein LOC108830791 [Raphanus sativus]